MTKIKTLLVEYYPSGIVGKGKKRTKRVKSYLTPHQYETKFYGGAYHSRTETAITAKIAPKTIIKAKPTKTHKKTQTGFVCGKYKLW